MKTSEQERLRLEKLYNHLYHRVDGKFDWSKCIYCNSNMQVWDHCPPLSYCESIDVQQYKNNGNTFTLYPCCNICNNQLNSYKESDIYLRFEHLINAYTKKISKYVQWTDTELNELGYSLRTFIKNKQSIYNIFRKKINILKNKYYSNDYITLLKDGNDRDETININVVKSEIKQGRDRVQSTTRKPSRKTQVYTSFDFRNY